MVMMATKRFSLTAILLLSVSGAVTTKQLSSSTFPSRPARSSGTGVQLSPVWEVALKRGLEDINPFLTSSDIAGLQTLPNCPSVEGFCSNWPGVFSGLWFGATGNEEDDGKEDKDNVFVAITDRGPNADCFTSSQSPAPEGKGFPVARFAPTLLKLEFNEGNGRGRVVDSCYLKRTDGSPITGLPIPASLARPETFPADDPSYKSNGTTCLTTPPEPAADEGGLDSEGVQYIGRGLYLVVDEYGASISVVRGWDLGEDREDREDNQDDEEDERGDDSEEGDDKDDEDEEGDDESRDKSEQGDDDRGDNNERGDAERGDDDNEQGDNDEDDDQGGDDDNEQGDNDEDEDEGGDDDEGDDGGDDENEGGDDDGGDDDGDENVNPNENNDNNGERGDDDEDDDEEDMYRAKTNQGDCGKILKRYVPQGYPNLPGAGYPVNNQILPALFGKRRNNRGFEGLAVSPSGNTAYAFLQSNLLQNSHIVPFVRLNVAPVKSGGDIEVTGIFLYLFSRVVEDNGTGTTWEPNPAGVTPPRVRDVKISAAAWATPYVSSSQDVILVDERTDYQFKLFLIEVDESANLLTAVSRDYQVVDDFINRMDLLGRNAAGGYDDQMKYHNNEVTNAVNKKVNAVRKALVLDSASTDGWSGSGKQEGIAILNKCVVVSGDDNDFGLLGTPPSTLRALQLTRCLDTIYDADLKNAPYLGRKLAM